MGRCSGDPFFGAWAHADGTRLPDAGLALAELIRGNWLEEDQGILRDFGKLVTQIDATCATADQFIENRMRGIERIGDASIVKNAYSRALRAYSLFGLRLGGIEEQYVAPITFGDLNTGNWMADFMNSYAWTIAGGSEEVQRNIISERMLEMPREPKGWVL